MKRHLVLTGEKGVGKSAILRLLAASWEGPVGGFHTPCRPAGGGKGVEVRSMDGQRRMEAELPVFQRKPALQIHDRAVWLKGTGAFLVPRQQHRPVFGIVPAQHAQGIQALFDAEPAAKPPEFLLQRV